MSKLMAGLAVAFLGLTLTASAQAQHHGYQQSTRGHYDYVPGQVQRHGNHADYVPGHYDYHRTPNYHGGHTSQYPQNGGYYNGGSYNGGIYAPSYRPNYYSPSSPCR